MAFENHTDLARRGASVAVDGLDEGLRAYMLRVYNYMALGVALTGAVAYLVAETELSLVLFSNSIMPLALMLGTLGLVFFLSARINKIQASTAQALFWLYAGLNGAWLSMIFLIYTGESIVRVFFISAASFAALSLYGYTTKKNLSAFGSFLIMGLFGLVIASVVNIFLGSQQLEWLLSVLGVLIFAGLTAYDTQRIKNMYYEADDREVALKKSIIGALTLYLDFINLFLYLLRFFSNRR